MAHQLCHFSFSLWLLGVCCGSKVSFNDVASGRIDNFIIEKDVGAYSLPVTHNKQDEGLPRMKIYDLRAETLHNRLTLEWTAPKTHHKLKTGKIQNI